MFAVDFDVKSEENDIRDHPHYDKFQGLRSQLAKAHQGSITWPEFLRYVYDQFQRWNGPFPDLRHIFAVDDIETILAKAAEHVECVSLRVITLIALGFRYKHEPQIDPSTGKPLLRARRTALHRAYDRRHSHVALNLLFEIYHRFDLNCSDENGFTHFHVACGAGFERYVLKFLKEGLDPNCPGNATGDSPLHMALSHKSRENQRVAETLFVRGADPNVANVEGLRPLHLVCMACDYEFLARFLACNMGAGYPLKINARDKHGNTALHLAPRGRAPTGVVRLLLYEGADPNLCNNSGETSLHVMARTQGRSEAVHFFEVVNQLLLPVETDPRDYSGNTPLHLAARYGNIHVIDMFLRRGADPNLSNDEGSTMLHLICRNDCENDALDSFFYDKRRARLTLRQLEPLDNLGRTPLQLGVAKGAHHMVDILLCRGANLAKFVFPPQRHFELLCDEYDESAMRTMALAKVAGFMLTLERLGEPGYELRRSDVLTVMRIFDKYRLVDMVEEPSPSSFVDDPVARGAAEAITIARDLSLYQLIELPARKAAQKVTYTDYYYFERRDQLYGLPENSRLPCSRHLCNKMTQKFYRVWALDALWLLTGYRVPMESCDKIVAEYTMTKEDLWNLVEAVADL